MGVPIVVMEQVRVSPIVVMEERAARQRGSWRADIPLAGGGVSRWQKEWCWGANPIRSGVGCGGQTQQSIIGGVPNITRSVLGIIGGSIPDILEMLVVLPRKKHNASQREKLINCNFTRGFEHVTPSCDRWGTPYIGQ